MNGLFIVITTQPINFKKKEKGFAAPPYLKHLKLIFPFPLLLCCMLWEVIGMNKTTHSYSFVKKKNLKFNVGKSLYGQIP